MDQEGEYLVFITPRYQPSVLIVTIGILLFLAGFIFIGAFMWWTTRPFRQRTKTKGVAVASANGVVLSQPFTNSYIRTLSGYWNDSNGNVTFTSNPVQRWSFNGTFLTNMTTYRSLYRDNYSVYLKQLPPPNSSRREFTWVFTGTSLITSSSASTQEQMVITDNGASQLSFSQVPAGTAVTFNQTLFLSS
jgi:hypothetical protein